MGHSVLDLGLTQEAQSRVVRAYTAAKSAGLYKPGESRPAASGGGPMQLLVGGVQGGMLGLKMIRGRG